MKCVLISLTILLLICCETQEQTVQLDFIVEGQTGLYIDSVLTPYVEEIRKLTDNTSGLAIGVTKGDKIIYAKTFGYAHIENKTKVDLNTGFHIASLSKPFSAIAIATLMEASKIKLSDYVIDYIPEFTMMGDEYDKITIEHILTHTSGIPRHIATEDWTRPSYGPQALSENIGLAKNYELNFEPGSAYSYSNAAFDILGVVISRASGMPFHEYIRKEILEPAGMMNTSLMQEETGRPLQWASGYSYGLETQEWLPYPYNERVFPSSGVVASLLDMCKWGQLHVGKGTINGRQVLGKEYFDLVVSPKYDTPWGDKIGLSWYLQSYLDRPIIMHTGSDTGFEAMMYIYPKEDISITVMANSTFARTARIINATSEVLFGEDPKEYKLSAIAKFASTYNTEGIENAMGLWSEMKKDTLDIYYVDDDDILTSGAVLENGGHWAHSKDILEFYLSMDKSSTYAWRLLGNANLNLGDTLTAKSCYQKTLTINPNYEKGQIALDKLQ